MRIPAQSRGTRGKNTRIAYVTCSQRPKTGCTFDPPQTLPHCCQDDLRTDFKKSRSISRWLLNSFKTRNKPRGLRPSPTTWTEGFSALRTTRQVLKWMEPPWPYLYLTVTQPVPQLTSPSHCQEQVTKVPAYFLTSLTLTGILPPAASKSRKKVIVCIWVKH